MRTKNLIYLTANQRLWAGGCICSSVSVGKRDNSASPGTAIQVLRAGVPASDNDKTLKKSELTVGISLAKENWHCFHGLVIKALAGMQRVASEESGQPSLHVSL